MALDTDIKARNEAIENIYYALEVALKGTDFCVEKQYKFSQSYSVNPYTLKIDPKESEEVFDVPLCIGRRAPSGIVVPRVCIEVVDGITFNESTLYSKKGTSIKNAHAFIRYGIFCFNITELDKNFAKADAYCIDFIDAIHDFMEDKGKLEMYIADFAKEETDACEHLIDVLHGNCALRSVKRNKFM